VIDQTFRHNDSQNPSQDSGFREHALSDLNSYYDQFCQSIQVFEVTTEGEELWEAAKKQYEN